MPGNAIVAATDGKTVVNSPKHLVKGEITYDAKSFFARLGANYTSRRYYSYENDASVGGFVVVDRIERVRAQQLTRVGGHAHCPTPSRSKTSAIRASPNRIRDFAVPSGISSSTATSR